MEIYSELIKSIELGKSLETAAATLKPKLINLIEIIKQEIGILKNQEILLEASCNYYNCLGQNFPDRMAFLNSIDKLSLTEIRSYYKPPILVSIVAEAISIFLNEMPRWNSFSYKFIMYHPILLGVDYSQLSKRTLKDLGIIINANRSSINNMYTVSTAAGNLFCWLSTTYDWAITIRDKFPQFTSFKEIERLVNKEFIEYSTLEAVKNTIKNKEIDLDLIERVELPIILAILDL